MILTAMAAGRSGEGEPEAAVPDRSAEQLGARRRRVHGRDRARAAGGSGHRLGHPGPLRAPLHHRREQRAGQRSRAPCCCVAVDTWTHSTSAPTGASLAYSAISAALASIADPKYRANFAHLQVADKTEYALHHGLKAIVCIGETLEQRESGELWNVLDSQLKVPAQLCCQSRHHPHR